MYCPTVTELRPVFADEKHLGLVSQDSADSRLPV